MTPDVVQRLKNYAERYAQNDAERILVIDAANEIERLRRIYQEAREAALAIWQGK